MAAKHFRLKSLGPLKFQGNSASESDSILVVERLFHGARQAGG